MAYIRAALLVWLTMIVISIKLHPLPTPSIHRFSPPGLPSSIVVSRWTDGPAHEHIPHQEYSSSGISRCNKHLPSRPPRDTPSLHRDGPMDQRQARLRLAPGSRHARVSPCPSLARSSQPASGPGRLWHSQASRIMAMPGVREPRAVRHASAKIWASQMSDRPLSIQAQPEQSGIAISPFGERAVNRLAMPYGGVGGGSPQMVGEIVDLVLAGAGVDPKFVFSQQTLLLDLRRNDPRWPRFDPR
jgi:hypothetical protein